MEINLQELIKSLINLEKENTFNEITKRSGVHNLRKMVNGDTTPTVQSWWKLHKAYPLDIPEPSYTDGVNVFKNTVQGSVNGTANQADSMTFNVHENKQDLSPELATLIKLIKSKDNQFDLVMDLIQIVRERQ